MELVRQGFQVRALVFPNTPIGHIQHKHVEVYTGDITKPETLPSAFKGVDVVVHLAARVADHGPEQAFIKSIVDGTEHVIQAAAAENVKRMVHMSSLAVHAYTGHTASDETAPLDGNLNAYARTKVLAEKKVEEAQCKLETVIVRPGLFPYGPGDKNAFCNLAKALKERKMVLVDQGSKRFGLSYVDNLVQGLVLCATHPSAKNEVFVIADDEVMSWKVLLNDVANALGYPPVTRSVPGALAYGMSACVEVASERFGVEPLLTRYRIATVRNDLVFSNAKAKRLLGYSPRVGWKEGLDRTVQWYRTL